MRFDTYVEFLNEKLKFTEYGYQVVGSPNIKELREKTGLKKGDPVKFTATLNMLYSYNSVKDYRKMNGRGEDVKRYEKAWPFPRAVKGEYINKMNLIFDRWPTEEDVRLWRESLKKDGYRNPELITGLEFHLGICKVPDSGAAVPSYYEEEVRSTSPGAEVVVSFFTFNPKYEKGAPRIPDKFTENELRVVAEKVSKDQGLDFTVGRKYYSNPVEFEVILALWYVTVGKEKLLGPFSSKSIAQKELEELKKTHKQTGGDIDASKQDAWRISDKRNNYHEVTYDSKTYSNAQFTKLVSKMYKKDELLTLLRGKIGARNLGLLD